jgi:pimeloyl-ACP methyl ester carboxylesterase
MKTAIIIVGKHEPTEKRYKHIEQAFRQSGWEQVIALVPDWKIRNIQKLVAECAQKIPDDNQPLTFFGFSMGAMLALILSNKMPAENLILGSPSGYFTEYEPLLSENDKKWAKEYLEDFEQWSAKDVIAQTHAKNGYLLAGEQELRNWPEFNKWIQDLHTQTNWPVAILPDTGHEIEAEPYQTCIKHIIENLA